ncbi:MAG: OmpA family protein [Acidovorax sp.]
MLRENGFQQTDEGWELQLMDTLLFDVDSDHIEPGRRSSIERMGHALAGVGIDRLRVEGHTDDVGTATYNNRLSLRRASAVAQVLGESGIPRDQITVQGFGNSRPLTTGTDRDSRRENRRVAVVIPAQQP